MSAFEIKNDPRFTQGREFMKNKLYEEAIALFQSLTEDCGSKYGETSKETALAFFEYGNALLTAEEENPANDVLGNVEKKEDAPAAGGEKGKAAPVEDEPVDDEEEEEGEGGAEGEEEDEDQPEGDIQIAWECLEVARKILDDLKDSSKETQLLLSDIYIRLGDLMRFNDNNIDSIGEYNSALKIRNAICEPFDRSISDAHYALAVAHTYNASEKDSEVNPLKEKQSALEHYKKCRQCLQLWLKQSSSEDEKKDSQELVEILTETIDALEAEIKEQLKGVSGGSSSSSSAASSSAAAPLGSSTTTIGFGGSSTVFSGTSSTASAAAAPVVTMLQSKKKRPAAEAAATGGTAAENDAKVNRTM